MLFLDRSQFAIQINYSDNIKANYVGKLLARVVQKDKNKSIFKPIKKSQILSLSSRSNGGGGKVGSGGK